MMKAFPIAGWLIERGLLNMPEYDESQSARPTMGAKDDDMEGYVMGHLIHSLRRALEGEEGDFYHSFQRGRPLVPDAVINSQLPYEHAKQTLAPSSDGELETRPAVTDGRQGFHQFSSLPYEIRRKVWEQFSRDLATPSIMARFRVAVSRGARRFSKPFIAIDQWQRMQYVETQTLMAVSQETRDLVRRRFPECIQFRTQRADGTIRTGFMRFDPSRDIVYVLFSRHNGDLEAKVPITFTSKVQNLAVHFEPSDTSRISDTADVIRWAKKFPNLRTIFPVGCHRSRYLRWCFKVKVNHYSKVFARHNPFIYICPDFTSRADLDISKMPAGITGPMSTLIAEAKTLGVNVLPMVKIHSQAYPWIM